ncbi:hypothetical protein SAMN02746041_03234 [Desulfacinum hydrothermale DSM 13146]|uniref:Uncharacterized protein n=1 Tax=Desulfacinum hydrothermale DSM 13146 TaxID=1121390 RepID=A0A1W1XXQ8_9BACT|nr:hypothetical protein SAMN02746041_03234 [Desulfacinum hydrothermale DSM 13146]
MRSTVRLYMHFRDTISRRMNMMQSAYFIAGTMLLIGKISGGNAGGFVVIFMLILVIFGFWILIVVVRCIWDLDIRWNMQLSVRSVQNMTLYVLSGVWLRMVMPVCIGSKSHEDMSIQI